MKKYTFLAAVLLCFSSHVFAENGILEPTQNPEAPFRLFHTNNIYTLLKLDTRTGQIWQVQWGSSSERFTVPLDDEVIVTNGKPGRFTLHPTKNIFTFVLIDQESGNTWHVQWGDKGERFRYPIK